MTVVVEYELGGDGGAFEVGIAPSPDLARQRDESPWNPVYCSQHGNRGVGDTGCRMPTGERYAVSSPHVACSEAVSASQERPVETLQPRVLGYHRFGEG